MPIYCFALIPSGLTTSQNRVEEAFIRRVWHLLPTGYQDILVADHSFGRASLIQWLQKEQISYILHLKGEVSVTHCGRHRKLVDYHLHWREDHLFRNVAYRQDEAVIINLVLPWLMLGAEKPAEPWFLATDLTSFDLVVRGTFAAWESRSSSAMTSTICIGKKAGQGLCSDSA